MPTNMPTRRPRESKDTDSAWPFLTGAVPAGMIAIVAIVPWPLVLPTFATLAVTAAILVYMQASRRRRAISVAVRERARDTAGMLMLVGFGAAMMTDVGGALAALGEVETILAARSPSGSE
jgi:hypothetical protein